MKKFTIPALVLALGCTMIAAPQGKKDPAGTQTPAASTTDKKPAKTTKEKKEKPKKEKKHKSDTTTTPK